ncbi:thioredoxin-like protein [Exidia glandulosa HHB12029]|uniref:Thioredoxin-like protein n=1 Tax=Exidia glandulosa HHB12029 TaxID=1314781 RepID=A0A165GJK9_EXIGL|nr:thioredoxin-like protein [Exidia glandulosa HHB12029]
MVSSHAAPPTARRLIVLHQYSDFWCPWCYIGYREINAAIDRCRQEKLPVDFHIEYKPYILQPNLPEDHGVPRVDFLCSKLGEEKTDMLVKLVSDRGKTLGIDRMKSGPVRSTMRAHRLMLLAYKHGGARLQADTCQRIFYAYTEEEKDVGDPNTLADIAQELSILPRAQALAFLQTDEMTDEVQSLVDSAKANGVTGVPFTVIDNKWAIGGGQPPDVYYQIFAKLASVPAVPSAA